MQHRIGLHSDCGIEICVRILGETWTVASTGCVLSTRDLLIDHNIEDLGRVVPLREYFEQPHTTPILRRPPREFAAIAEDAPRGLAARYGGSPAFYEPIIAFFDLPHAFATPGADTLLLLHNSLGIYLAEEAFGVALEPIPGKLISTRSIGEDLVIARTGRIPSFGAIASSYALTPWMRGKDVPAGLRAG